MDLIDRADICPTLNKLTSLPLPAGFRFCQRNAIQHFQEKQKGRNKLVPRLLGVTKDSVLRLDEKTKEILKTWPLTTVKRWAASPNVFTLDFGDYQDQYYSVQTTEGEHISALIAGYIDIILKRRQRKERFGEDGNEEEAMEESFISPGRAIEIHGLPQTLKKAKPDSLAHPGVFRNSGREYLLLISDQFSLFILAYLFLYFIIFPAQEINFNGHSSSQKSIVTNGHQNGGFDAGVCFSYDFPSLHVRVSQKFFLSNHFEYL